MTNSVQKLFRHLRVLGLLVLAGCPSIISSDKAITSFGFLTTANPELSADYTGLIAGADITVSMPFYVDRSSLVATFATTGALLQVGGVEQASGVTANDFSVPVEYVAAASDGTTETYTVDATAPEKKVTAADAEAYDYFGRSVSISGDYAIAGGSGEDAGGSGAGAAYVFHRTGTNSWDSGVKLVASDARANDNFGYSVSIAGDYAIVGALNGDAGVSDYGAAYVFHCTGTNSWDSGVKLVATDAQAFDNFGYSVSIAGDYVIVGALNGDAGVSDAGAAYVFHRTGTNSWDSGVKLVASDAEAFDLFGNCVSFNGDYAIVGAPSESAGGTDAGATYVFHRTGTNSWDSGVKLVAFDAQAGDGFGFSVSISGDFAVVGALNEDAGGNSAGAMYVFHRTAANSWNEGVKLVASDAQADDQFGWSVSISGDFAIVGAYAEDAGGIDAGAAYIYHRTGTNIWVQVGKLVASDAQAGDQFGFSISINEDYTIVGARLEDAGGSDAGAAYVYH